MRYLAQTRNISGIFAVLLLKTKLRRQQNMNKKVLFIVQTAIIAALYAALTYAQNFLLPGTTSAAVQFRVSEALNVLALFTPAAIPGLTLGCVLSNLIISAGAYPLIRYFVSAVPAVPPEQWTF